MQRYKINNIEGDYEVGLENKAIIKELQLAPSRVADLKIPYMMAVGDCPSCPECVCADFLGEEFGTVVGIAAMTPVLLAAKVDFVIP